MFRKYAKTPEAIFKLAQEIRKNSQSDTPFTPENRFVLLSIGTEKYIVVDLANTHKRKYRARTGDGLFNFVTNSIHDAHNRLYVFCGADGYAMAVSEKDKANIDFQRQLDRYNAAVAAASLQIVHVEVI